MCRLNVSCVTVCMSLVWCGTGAVAVVDLVGYRKQSDGSKGDKLPDLAIGENVEVVMETGKFFEGFVESIAVRDFVVSCHRGLHLVCVVY